MEYKCTCQILQQSLQNGDSTVNGFTSESDEEEIVEIKAKAKGNKKRRNQRVIALGSDSESELDTFGKLSETEEDWQDTRKPRAKPRATKGKQPSKSEDVKLPEQPAPVQQETSETAQTCVTCNEKFPSKNKLFTHLKKTNHGVYIPKAGKSKDQPQRKADKASKKKA